jgi:hypothetical protein
MENCKNENQLEKLNDIAKEYNIDIKTAYEKKKKSLQSQSTSNFRPTPGSKDRMEGKPNNKPSSNPKFRS